MTTHRPTWGPCLLDPSEEAATEIVGWISRAAVPDGEEALRIAADERGCDEDRLQARAVLMREESEVEAEINGHECPLMVECTKRARRPEPFWRIEETPDAR